MNRHDAYAAAVAGLVLPAEWHLTVSLRPRLCSMASKSSRTEPSQSWSLRTPIPTMSSGLSAGTGSPLPSRSPGPPAGADVGSMPARSAHHDDIRLSPGAAVARLRTRSGLRPGPSPGWRAPAWRMGAVADVRRHDPRAAPGAGHTAQRKPDPASTHHSRPAPKSRTVEMMSECAQDARAGSHHRPPPSS